MKKLKIKWEHEDRTYFGTAIMSYDDYEEEWSIEFTDDIQNETFDQIKESDVHVEIIRPGETAEDVLNDIWKELEDMASQEEDGYANVTVFELA